MVDKTLLVKTWVRQSGADQIIPDKGKAFALGWKLLNDYLFFLESGHCPETKAELYDFTQFLDTFADLYAEDKDELYNWIVKHGHTIIDTIQHDEKVRETIPNAHCPLCSVPLTSQNVARNTDGLIRTSSVGRAWCKDCARKVDEKNWFESQ
jgi:hypothetical protein